MYNSYCEVFNNYYNERKIGAKRQIATVVAYLIFYADKFNKLPSMENMNIAFEKMSILDKERTIRVRYLCAPFVAYAKSNSKFKKTIIDKIEEEFEDDIKMIKEYLN